MEYKVKWNESSLKRLNSTPDKTMYFIARKTLDLTIPHVPWRTGRMARSTSGFRGSGVTKLDNNKYAIGSDTSYARKVYLYNDATTHWTTIGTYSHWFSRTWKEKKDIVSALAVNHFKLK